jgi:hypothetical protein
MNWTDLYSNDVNAATGTGQLATGPTGPNQSIVSGPGQGAPRAAGADGAAFSWLALVAGLVVLRILIQMGGRVATP